MVKFANVKEKVGLCLIYRQKIVWRELMFETWNTTTWCSIDFKIIHWRGYYRPVLSGYHKYSCASSRYHLGILVWSPQSITMSVTSTENQTIGSHLCENQMWELDFRKKQNKIWELDKVLPINQVRISGFSHHKQ